MDGVAAAAGAQPSAAEHGMLCALCFDPLLQAVFAQRPAALCPTSIRTALRFGGLWGPRSVSLLFALFEMVRPQAVLSAAIATAVTAAADADDDASMMLPLARCSQRSVCPRALPSRGRGFRVLHSFCCRPRPSPRLLF